MTFLEDEPLLFRSFVSDFRGVKDMSDRMRGLDSAAAFRDAIYRAVPFGTLAAFCWCNLLLHEPLV